MRFRGITLCRPAGVPVRLHWSVALLAVLLLPLPEFAAVPVPWRAALIVALLVSMAVHEAAHAATAARLGLEPAEVILTPAGGLTRTAAPIPDGPAGVAVALAGPAASLALAGVAGAAAWLLPEGRPRSAAAVLAAANGLLGVANLLPAAPLDGGRVLRALLAPRCGPERAARATAWAGRALGVALAAAAFRYGPVWLVPATLVLLGAAAEERSASLAEALRDPPVERAMIPSPLLVPADSPEASLAAVARSAPDRPVLAVRDGRPVAYVALSADGAAVRPLGPPARRGERAAAVLARLEAAGREAAAVLGPSGEPEGLVTAGALRRALRLGRALSGRVGGDGARRPERPAGP